MKKNRHSGLCRTLSTRITVLGILILAGFAAFVPSAAAQDAPAAKEGLPKGFRGVELGMTLEEVEKRPEKGRTLLLSRRSGRDPASAPQREAPGSPGTFVRETRLFPVPRGQLFSAIYVMNTEKNRPLLYILPALRIATESRTNCPLRKASDRWRGPRLPGAPPDRQVRGRGRIGEAETVRRDAPVLGGAVPQRFPGRFLEGPSPEAHGGPRARRKPLQSRRESSFHLGRPALVELIWEFRQEGDGK